eukprot:2645858-Lingulodinium_polyedra.AAC.1
MTFEEADRTFGRGQWRPMPLFRTVQASGKARLIADGRRGGHNDATSEEETLWIISVDFVAEAARALVLEQGAVRAGVRADELAAMPPETA